jgi:uncharacterized protein DUF4339
MAITEWHYTVNGQPAAVPVNAAQLKKLADSGQLQPTDLVWQDGMLEWAPAGSIKGLFPADKLLNDSAALPTSATRKITTGRKTTKLPSRSDWRKLHPLLVFVLTLASGGIFGLIYSYKVCQAYSAKAAERKLDSAGRTLGRVRHPFGVLLLSYLTLGFSFYYWLYRALGECNEYLGRKDVPLRAELSLMLIFPPYALYLVVFVLPELIRQAQTQANVPETEQLRQGVFFLNPILLLVVPVFGMICQEGLNQIWLTAP